MTPQTDRISWVRSSRSNGGTNCVEVAMLPPTEPALRGHWVKSIHSDGGATCVEAAALPPLLGVRDSKVAGGPVLTFPSASFLSWVNSLA